MPPFPAASIPHRNPLAGVWRADPVKSNDNVTEQGSFRQKIMLPSLTLFSKEIPEDGAVAVGFVDMWATQA
jgi:hypothetical protein